MIDLRVYALVDPERAREPLPALARRLADGGATLIQLRDKLRSTRRLVEEARAVKEALIPTGVPFLINDRVDVALAAAADGVHIGQDDMSPADARRVLGRKAIIGLSVHSLAELAASSLDALDYVAVGAVFATASKDDAPAPIGPAGVRQLVAAIRARAPKLPICAISGIDASNAGEVIAAGADGVAVISALSMAADPRAAARELRTVVDTTLATRVDA